MGGPAPLGNRTNLNIMVRVRRQYREHDGGSCARHLISRPKWRQTLCNPE